MKALIVGGLAAVVLAAGAVTSPLFAQTKLDQQSEPNIGWQPCLESGGIFAVRSSIAAA